MLAAILILLTSLLMSIHLRYVELRAPLVALDDKGCPQQVGVGLLPRNALIQALLSLFTYPRWTSFATHPDDEARERPQATPVPNLFERYKHDDKDPYAAILELGHSMGLGTVAPPKPSPVPMGAEEALSRLSEQFGRNARPNEGPEETLDRWNQTVNWGTNYLLARPRLSLAANLAGDNGQTTISHMSPRKVSDHLNYTFFGVNPPIAYYNKMLPYVSESLNPDQRDLWIIANYQTAVAKHYSEDRRNRAPELGTRMIVGALEGVPYLMELGSGLFLVMWLFRSLNGSRASFPVRRL